MSGKDPGPTQRAPMLVLAVISLIFGVLGGLWRLDWEVPLPGTEPASFHGALMIAAFFGTVMGLERAAAYGQRRGYLAPACSSVGGLLTALGWPHPFSATLLLAGSAGLAALTFASWRRQPAPHTLLSLAGALCGVAGSALWLAGLPAREAIGTWLAFLALTVSGERLELSHLRRPAARPLIVLATATALHLVGAFILPLHWKTGAATIGVALIGLAGWLMLHDIARLNLRHHGQVCFTSVCLLGGYVWLGVGGLLLPFAAAFGPVYDAALHAVFLGFVFAMVMGHASIIVPALLGVELPYTPLSYLPLALLHATLILRIVGDLAGQEQWRAWGGMGNAVALALFLLMTVAGVLQSRRA